MFKVLIVFIIVVCLLVFSDFRIAFKVLDSIYLERKSGHLLYVDGLELLYLDENNQVKQARLNVESQNKNQIKELKAIVKKHCDFKKAVRILVKNKQKDLEIVDLFCNNVKITEKLRLVK